jgi:hypothetical protein
MVAQRPPARLGRGQEVDLGAACREAGQASHRPASFERAAITRGTRAAGNHGGGVPALTRRQTGLAHDAGAAVARPPASEATGAGGVGTYAVTPGAPAAGGYTAGTFHQGALTVNPAGLTATADNQAVTGGGGVPALTCKHTGLAHGGASAAFTGGPAATANGGSTVGGYPITRATLTATGIYTVGAFNGGTLAVNPAPLPGTAEDASRY